MHAGRVALNVTLCALPPCALINNSEALDRNLVVWSWKRDISRGPGYCLAGVNAHHCKRVA